MSKLSGNCGVKVLSNFGGIVIKCENGDYLDYQVYDNEIVTDVEVEYFGDTEDVLGYGNEDPTEVYAGFRIGTDVHFLGEFMRTYINA